MTSLKKLHIIGIITKSPISFLDICLNGFVIDSTGIAKQHTPFLLGLYLNHNVSNGKQSFKHVNENIFLYWNLTHGQWVVSKAIKDKSYDSCNLSFANGEHNILKFSYLYHFYGRLPTIIIPTLLLSIIPVANNQFQRNVMQQNGRFGRKLNSN